jgi:uncharacterized protein YndB with AHSA1/START domain
MYGGSDESQEVSDGPISVGTKFREEFKLMGRRMESTNEITEYDPPTRFSYVNRMGERQEERARLTFTAVGEGTQLSVTSEGEMGGVADLLAPITSWMFSKQIRSLFKKLKAVLETPDRSTVQ